jgi:hypothetical protein
VFNNTVKGLRAKTEVWCHTCWGNPSQQRMFGSVQSYRPALALLNQVDADVITFEMKSSNLMDLAEVGAAITDMKVCVGAITDRLAGLPAEFQAIRNPFSGEVGGCVVATEGGNCIGGAFASLNSAVFRNRGGSLTYGVNLGRTQAGVGVGYDRRKFIAATGTVLAAANGEVDENYWGAIYARTRLDNRSSLAANAYANWFDNGLTGDRALGYSASLAYYRQIIAGLTGTAAVGLDGITQDSLPVGQAASALLGLRYTF